jgi:peroxiredoxin
MGQARKQRQATKAAAERRSHGRKVWAATGLVVLVIAGATGLLVSRINDAPAPAAATTQAASDQNAAPSLVAAANAVGFRTTTEPGVGLLEDRPAGDASPPSTSDLLKPGTTAPPFTLKTPQGQTVKLSDYRGKALLVEFFATWCPHCQAEAPHLAKLAGQLASHKVAFLSVNADSEDAASVFAFHRYFGLPYPALLDPGQPAGSFTSQGGSGPVTSAYHLHAYPTFYVITPSGKVAWASDGEQPDALLRQQLLHAAAQ